MENINVVVKKFISVAGYSLPLKVGTEDTKNLKEKFDWQRIKKHCQEFVFINADNDPWGADDKQGQVMVNNLGGTLIVNHEGHMGSDKFNQPYKQIPFLLELIN